MIEHVDPEQYDQIPEQYKKPLPEDNVASAIINDNLHS
jgi:hypothetical protein